jgi:hypothetical protein
MADSVLLSWQKNTTHTAVIGELDRQRAQQLAAIDARALALANARRTYAESYRDLQLQFQELTDAQTQLSDLSQQENKRAATIKFLIELAKIYEEVRKKTESSSNK